MLVEPRWGLPLVPDVPPFPLGTRNDTHVRGLQSPPQFMHLQGEENIMGEISTLLQNKIGLSADQSQEAEKLIVELILSKVPSEFQGVVSSVLGAAPTAGRPAESGGLGSLFSAAEGMFGNKS
jgi:hypothetical protein